MRMTAIKQQSCSPWSGCGGDTTSVTSSVNRRASASEIVEEDAHKITTSSG